MKLLPLLDGPSPVRHGAFVMLDALGFKGIWQSHDEAAVLHRMRELREAMLETLRRTNESREAARMSAEQELKTKLTPLDAPTVHFLSDTIVIACPKGEGGLGLQRLFDGYTVLSACTLAQAAIQHAAEGGPPLALRGCVTLGNFAVEDQVVLGAAVDEAAEGERLAEGAFCWLTPTAARAASLVEWHQEVLIDYDVPMKQSPPLRTKVVLPLSSALEDPGQTRDAILRTFDRSPSLSVYIKRQNTERFLDAAMEHLAKRS